MSTVEGCLPAVQNTKHWHSVRVCCIPNFSHRQHVPVDVDVLGEPAGDERHARVQPQPLLDARLQVLHLVQLLHRGEALPVAAHDLVDLLHDPVLDGRLGAEQQQYPGDGGRGRVVPLEHERVHLLADVLVRQIVVLVVVAVLIRTNSTTSAIVVVVVVVFVAQLLLLASDLLLPLVDDAVGEFVQDGETLLMVLVVLRELEDEIWL